MEKQATQTCMLIRDGQIKIALHYFLSYLELMRIITSGMEVILSLLLDYICTWDMKILYCETSQDV